MSWETCWIYTVLCVAALMAFGMGYCAGRLDGEKSLANEVQAAPEVDWPTFPGLWRNEGGNAGIDYGCNIFGRADRDRDGTIYVTINGREERFYEYQNEFGGYPWRLVTTQGVPFPGRPWGTPGHWMTDDGYDLTEAEYQSKLDAWEKLRRSTYAAYYASAPE